MGGFSPSWRLRLATRADIPAIEPLMASSIRELMRGLLRDDQVEASFAIMGLDTQLIDDGTYFAIDDEGRIAGCGGWSRRATLFGGNHTAGRSDALLDPARDPARVRAMYTHPDYARRGIGRAILAACESAAQAEGFRNLELAATMAGVPLYRACGYAPIEAFEQATPSGVAVPLVRMGKAI